MFVVAALSVHFVLRAESRFGTHVVSCRFQKDYGEFAPPTSAGVRWFGTSADGERPPTTPLVQRRFLDGLRFPHQRLRDAPKPEVTGWGQSSFRAVLFDGLDYNVPVADALKNARRNNFGTSCFGIVAKRISTIDLLRIACSEELWSRSFCNPWATTRSFGVMSASKRPIHREYAPISVHCGCGQGIGAAKRGRFANTGIGKEDIVGGCDLTSEDTAWGKFHQGDVVCCRTRLQFRHSTEPQ